MNISNTGRWLVLILIIHSLPSCKTYAVTFKEYIENEVSYYEIAENSKVLDFSAGQTAKITAMALTYNNVDFHLGYAPKKPLSNYKKTQQTFENIKKKYNSENEATFSGINQKGDTLLLNDEQFDYIICANNLYNFNDFKTIISEFYRVLKADGQLLIIQQVVPKGELSKKDFAYIEGSPLPYTNTLIPYFQKNGFSFQDSTKIILNIKMGKVTKEQVYLLKFKRK